MTPSPSPISPGHTSSFNLGRRLAYALLLGLLVAAAASAYAVATRPASTDPGVIGRSGSLRDEARDAAAAVAALTFADHVTDIDGALPAGWTRLDNHSFHSDTPYVDVSVNWYDGSGQTLAQAVAQHRSFDADAGRRTLRAVPSRVAGRDAVRMEVQSLNAPAGEYQVLWMAVEDDEVLTVTARMDSRMSMPQVEDVLSRLQVR